MKKIEIRVDKRTRTVELAGCGGLFLENFWTVSRKRDGKRSANVVFSSAGAALSAARQVEKRSRELGIEVSTVVAA